MAHGPCAFARIGQGGLCLGLQQQGWGTEKQITKRCMDSKSGTSRLPPSWAALPASDTLRLRLPVLISTLIVVMLITFLWAAYKEVERTLTQAGGGRAQVTADQVAGILAQSAQQRL